MQDTNRAGTFSGRVVVLFGSQVIGAGLGIVNGILLARLLGPAAKGDYYFLVLLPATAIVLLQLGLPSAFGFFGARGQTAGILAKAIALSAALSVVAILGVAVLVPLIRDAALRSVGLAQILFVFLAFPLALNATFTTAIVLGRQGVRWYAGVEVALSVTTLVLLVVVLGGLDPSLNGALAVYLMSVAIQSIGLAIGARRVCAANARAESVSYRALFKYGVRFFPGSLAGFFSYRVDAFLIAFMVTAASEQLGYYSMAVGLAEMVFFFPRAVTALFFPHVAASPRDDADRHVPLMARVTLLVTGVIAVTMIPAAVVLIRLILPAFIPSLAPLVVLLPAVVALSVAWACSGYLSGIGRPGISSSVSVISLTVNIACNLLLIPRYGIMGASAASLVSYTLSAILLTTVVARLSHARVIDFWIPRVSDVRYLGVTTAGLLRRFVEKSRTTLDQRGA